jgi:chromosome segregation ATPase
LVLSIQSLTFTGIKIVIHAVMKKTQTKIKVITAILALVLVSATSFAQPVSTDSITALKQQKNVLELSKQINDRKLKLAKLENTVEQKTMDMQRTAEQAQKSANANAEAANDLSKDPQDKSLARKANKAAGNAKADARHARIAAGDLADLKKDIESLKDKIAKDEAKLASMQALNPPASQQ